MRLLWPWFVCWLVGAALLAVDGRKRWVGITAVVVLCGLFVADFAFLVQMAAQPDSTLELTTGGHPLGVGIRLRVDRLSLVFAVICSAVLAGVMLHESPSSLRSRYFPALVLLLACGLHGAFFTGDLFNFYVFFELSMMCSFALAAYGYGRTEVRAAFIYVAVNLLGSFLFLVGVATVYHRTGTLDLAQLGTLSETSAEPLIVPATALFAALSLKLGLFPLHGWVPVLYSHARPAVAAALSGALANIAAYGLLRLGFSVFGAAREIAAPVLLVLGAIAVVYGALLAVHRKQPAEVAAYAAIAHAGFIVLGLGVGGVHGVMAIVLMVLSGSIDKSLMFLSLETHESRRGWISLVAAGSAAGLPLTIGFIAKLQLLRAALEAPASWAVVLAICVSTILLLVGVFRFRRLVRRHPAPAAPGHGAAAFALSGATLVLGIAPTPMSRLVQDLGAQLAGVGR